MADLRLVLAEHGLIVVESVPQVRTILIKNPSYIIPSYDDIWGISGLPRRVTLAFPYIAWIFNLNKLPCHDYGSHQSELLKIGFRNEPLPEDCLDEACYFPIMPNVYEDNSVCIHQENKTIENPIVENLIGEFWQSAFVCEYGWTARTMIKDTSLRDFERWEKLTGESFLNRDLSFITKVRWMFPKTVSKLMGSEDEVEK